VCGVSRT